MMPMPTHPPEIEGRMDGERLIEAIRRAPNDQRKIVGGEYTGGAPGYKEKRSGAALSAAQELLNGSTLADKWTISLEPIRSEKDLSGVTLKAGGSVTDDSQIIGMKLVAERSSR